MLTTHLMRSCATPMQVVDSTDRGRVGIARKELTNLLSHEHLQGVGDLTSSFFHIPLTKITEGCRTSLSGGFTCVTGDLRKPHARIQVTICNRCSLAMATR